MLKTIIISSLLATCTLNIALADTPAFFAGKKTYASDWKACVGFADGGAPDDSYTIDKSSVSGYEFSCQFVEMKLIPDWTGQDRQNNYIGIASCSDDSGISRPDMFNISYYENTVTITSQNDFIVDMVNPQQNAEGQPFGFINKQFELCQPE